MSIDEYFDYLEKIFLKCGQFIMLDKSPDEMMLLMLTLSGFIKLFVPQYSWIHCNLSNLQLILIIMQLARYLMLGMLVWIFRYSNMIMKFDILSIVMGVIFQIICYHDSAIDIIKLVLTYLILLTGMYEFIKYITDIYEPEQTRRGDKIFCHFYDSSKYIIVGYFILFANNLAKSLLTN